jgi:hypothetical protein
MAAVADRIEEYSRYVSDFNSTGFCYRKPVVYFKIELWLLDIFDYYIHSL